MIAGVFTAKCKTEEIVPPAEIGIVERTLILYRLCSAASGNKNKAG